MPVWLDWTAQQKQAATAQQPAATPADEDVDWGDAQPMTPDAKPKARPSKRSEEQSEESDLAQEKQINSLREKEARNNLEAKFGGSGEIFAKAQCDAALAAARGRCANWKFSVQIFLYGYGRRCRISKSYQNI